MPLHTILHVFTQFTECTSTDCKYNGIKILSYDTLPLPCNDGLYGFPVFALANMQQLFTFTLCYFEYQFTELF
jgi:hypothetical protein